MNNTIILLNGTEYLTEREYKEFSKGDTIFGADAKPKELKRWNIEQEKEALEELRKYRCSYSKSGVTWAIEEYALQYCECNSDGEMITGSDFELAEV